MPKCLMTLGSRRSQGAPSMTWVGWERNNFDRVVHFGYGLMLAYPVREDVPACGRRAGLLGILLAARPHDVDLDALRADRMGSGAEVFGGDLGAAYLGTQGDVWDAHKDMALASLGALIAMCVTAWINWRTRRDFAMSGSKAYASEKQQAFGAKWRSPRRIRATGRNEFSGSVSHARRDPPVRCDDSGSSRCSRHHRHKGAGRVVRREPRSKASVR